MKEAMNIVNISGGLGNQMFQYAFWRSLCFRFPERLHYINLEYLRIWSQHNGYELDRIFGIDKNIEFPLPWNEWIRQLSTDQVEWTKEQASTFYQSIEKIECPVRIFTGYWQSELYFKDIEKEIRTIFQFQKKLLNKRTKDIARKMEVGLSVSVHIRRQDYLSPNNLNIFGNICTPEYYEAAWNMLIQQVSSGPLDIYFFSDDPDWVKTHIACKNSVVIDWNRGEDSWQDMYLISVCRYHILANSSFGWWGAWLDERKDKIIIAPEVWFNNRLSFDILPDTWKSPVYMKKRWIDIVHNNLTCIPIKGLFHGQMGLVIFFFHYACIKDISYRETAERLLDSLLDSLSIEMSDNYADGLAGIGTAIEYLLQNGFVTGDADEILAEIDERLVTSMLHISLSDPDSSKNICGWLRYFRFRLQQWNIKTKSIYQLNKQMLSHGLFYLEELADIPLAACNEIISELGYIGRKGLFPERVEKLLRLFLHDSDNNYNTLLQKAENINGKRITSLVMDHSFGLRGLAGKELLSLSVQSVIPWTELI